MDDAQLVECIRLASEGLIHHSQELFYAAANLKHAIRELESRAALMVNIVAEGLNKGKSD